MQINCDLGESYGSWQMGNDAKIMPLIDQANIATGFHAGDPVTMRRSIELAKQHQVAIGAHPAYPDLHGFGRRSMKIAPAELADLLLYQVSALDGMAQSLHAELTYLKPHGALYHDMMTNIDVMAVVVSVVQQFYRPLTLMVQALPWHNPVYQPIQTLLSQSGIDCWYEVFADRRYHNDGRLVSRAEPGAVLTTQELKQQVCSLVCHRSVTTLEGEQLTLAADTLCVHGDSDRAVQNAQVVRALISDNTTTKNN